jgi:hypothetical protein
MAGGGSNSMKAGWIMPMRMDELVGWSEGWMDGGCIGDLKLGLCWQTPLVLGLERFQGWGWSWGARPLGYDYLNYSYNCNFGGQRVFQWLMQGRRDARPRLLQ